MKKTTTAACVTLVSILLLSVVSPAKASSPVRDPSLTFDLSFDKRSPTADFAKGNPASTTFSENLEFRTIPGFNQQNAFNKLDGEIVNYETKDNANPENGTLIIWVMAKNYEPGTVTLADAEKSHKSYAVLEFRNGDQWLKMYVYQFYAAPTAFFYWESSLSPKDGYKLAGTSLTNIRQGEWFQIAATWTKDSIKIFLNGQFQTQTKLGAEAEEAVAINFNPKESFIGIRGTPWPNDPNVDTGKETVVDDIKIYDRALSDTEIQKQYLAVRPESAAEGKILPSVDMQFHGVDNGSSESLNSLSVDFDYHMLPLQLQDAIKAKSARAEIQIQSPSGKSVVEKWTPGALNESRIIQGITEAGKYHVELTLRGADGKTEKVDGGFERPDTSWLGNTLGLDKTVPPPWTPVKVQGNQTVSVWGRDYCFNGQPLPQSIMTKEGEMLASPLRLVVETNHGPATVRYELKDTKVSDRHVDFSGTGVGDGFTMDWKTRVEFDGLVRADFRMHGEPHITRLAYEWTVKRPFAEYVLNPLWKQTGNGVYEAPFPASAGRAGPNSVLWLTSEKQGFCWSVEDDANWIYDPKQDTPIRAEITDEGGRCSVTMVNRAVTVPEGAAYGGAWMATPSRPLPEKSRTYRFGAAYGNQSNSGVALVQTSGEGTDGTFSLKPSESFARYLEMLKGQNLTRLAPYGAGTALNNTCLEGRYFYRYWDIPGGPVVPFEDTFDGTRCLQTNTCPNSAGYSDLIIHNIKQLLDKSDNQYKAIYFDLVMNYCCKNPLHGCQFKDAFGRTISRFITMGLRRHLMRVMAYCHSRGLQTIWHDHSFYNPVIDSSADYWWPGEQYENESLAKNTPYFYSDEIADAVYRTELNQNIKGSAVLLLPQLSRISDKYGDPEQTKAMCTKMMLNDVSLSMAWCDTKVISRIWDVWQKYDLDAASVMKYFNPGNQITSTNPEVKVTYYKNPDGRFLAVVGNTSPSPQTATINLSKVKADLQEVRDEYEEETLQAPSGKLVLEIPPRQFVLLGF